MIGSATLLYWASFRIYIAFFFTHLIYRKGRRARRERAFLWGNSPSSRLRGVWFREYLLLNDFLFPFPFRILQFSFICLISWFSLIWQVEGGARVMDWDIATPRSSSRKFILTGDRHSSSFFNPSIDSRYVSYVSFSFIFCTCIAHHSIKVKTLIS